MDAGSGTGGGVATLMGIIEEKVVALVEEAASAEGCEVVEVVFRPGRGRGVLRVFIDKAKGETAEEGETAGSGVSFADCQAVSRRLSALLDVEDPIPDAFSLEVSSPGLTRPLKKQADYVRFTGRLAVIRTREPVGGESRFVGRLAGLEGNGECVVLLESAKGPLQRIPLSSIAKANLDF